MKHLITGAALAAMLATGAAQAQETLRMATIAPSLGQAITMATFANIVNDNLEGVTIEVAGGAAGQRRLRAGFLQDRPLPDHVPLEKLLRGSGRNEKQQRGEDGVRTRH